MNFKTYRPESEKAFTALGQLGDLIKP